MTAGDMVAMRASADHVEFWSTICEHCGPTCERCTCDECPCCGEAWAHCECAYELGP